MENSIRDQFIPKQKLDFLQIDGTSEEAKALLKKPRHFEAAVVRMGLPGIEPGLGCEEAVQMFERLSEHVEQCVPAFMNWGGVVDHYASDGVQMLFMDNEAGAVSAAIRAREMLLKQKELWKDLTFGISYGHVILGVLGGAGSYSVMSVSHASSISEFLQRAAAKYSSSILVTEQLLEKDESVMSKYTCRLLGKFYFSNIHKALKVYDFYDGDDIAVRTAKRKTALLFDKGVSFFLEGDFAQARSYFIEVIKANRMDKAARIYLSLCDNFRENPPESPEAFCIERV